MHVILLYWFMYLDSFCFKLHPNNINSELDFSAVSLGSNLSIIFFQGREIDLQIGTDVRDGNGTTRVINWSGCIVHDPHPAVRALGFLPEEGHGVYVAR